MGWEGLDKPHHTGFIAARKLRNRNVMYQVNSREAADWMRQKDVQEAFMKYYDRTKSNIWNKLHYTIAEFVPTTYDAGVGCEARRRQCDSRIVFLKFIKLPHLRAENQKVAHVTIRFNHREDAIQNGM
jgi:hypothetical protein